MNAYQRTIRRLGGETNPPASSLNEQSHQDALPSIEKEVVFPVQSLHEALGTSISDDLKEKANKSVFIEEQILEIDAESKKIKSEVMELELHFAELHFAAVIQSTDDSDRETDVYEEHPEYFDQIDNFSTVRNQLRQAITHLIKIEQKRLKMIDDYTLETNQLISLSQGLSKPQRQNVEQLINAKLAAFSSIENIAISDGEIEELEGEDSGFDSFMDEIGRLPQAKIIRSDSSFLLEE